MEKLHFDSDYMRGCHPEILDSLCAQIWSRLQAMAAMLIRHVPRD